MFQSVTISDGIRVDPSLLAKVERTTKHLDELIGNNAKLVSVRWQKSLDELNHEVVRLTMQDWTGEVESVLRPDDLDHADELEWRWHRLYGDLMQIRSRKLLENLQAVGDSQ